MAQPRRQKPLTPEEVEHHSFGPARRGFDVEEVRAFLAEVADELRQLSDRERILNREIDRLQMRLRTAAPVAAPAADLDEAALTAALGAEAAAILRSAHQAADEITTKADEHAARVTRDANDQA